MMPLSLGKLLALGTGTVATVAAASIAWIGTHQGPKPPTSKSPGTQAPRLTDSVLVCVGSDDLLRSPQGERCEASQRRYVLDHGETKLLDCDDCTAWPPTAPVEPPTNEPLADLERRLNRLHKSPLFTVVNDDGDVIFSVGPERTALYNGDGALVAYADATADGGTFTARAAGGNLVTTVGVSTTHAGLAVAEEGQQRVDLGRQPAENYALRILASSEGQVAGIGESRDQSGTVAINDTQARLRASMSVATGVGAFHIFSVGGKSVLSMRQSLSGAGLLSIGNSDGAEVVKMDVNDNRYGAVLAGPRLGFPLVTGSGLPGSYILGCAGGSGCRPYQ